MLERPPAIRLLAQPEGAHKWNFRPAVRGLAAHGPGPEVGDGCRAVRMLRVEVGQLLLRLPLDLRTDAAQLLGELWPVARNVLEHHLEDQAGDGVQVARERLAPEPQRLERDRTAPRERVHDQRRLIAMRRPHQRTTHLEIGTLCCVIPVREIPDELEQRLAQVLVRRADPAQNLRQHLPRLRLELRRAERIAWVWPQQREQHRPARSQRPPRPP